MKRRTRKDVKVMNVSSNELKEKRATTALLAVFALVFVYSAFQYDSYSGQAVSLKAMAPVNRQPSSFGSGGSPMGNDTGGPSISKTQTNITGNRTMSRQYAKRVFLTNNTFNGNLGGYYGAKTKCNDIAHNAGLASSWVPWLSVLTNNTNGTTINARDEIRDGYYVRLDRKVVAKNKADLIDGNIQNPINVDERGNIHYGWPYGVWTGTGYNGMATGFDCNGWTGGFLPSGTFGSKDATNQSWTNSGNSFNCLYDISRLYCFEW